MYSVYKYGMYIVYIVHANTDTCIQTFLRVTESQQDAVEPEVLE